MGLAALERTAAKNQALIETLVPLAQELAKKAGETGVTVADLRITAVQRGLLTGEEKGRALSFLGAVMKRAGLQATYELRRSQIPATHGIRNRVWVRP